MRGGALKSVMLTLAACALLAACDAVDVVVARAGVTVDGGALQGCSSNADCEADLFCSKSTCGDTRGTCEVRPYPCTDGSLAPVCGCDGVVYWNDCLRQADGVAATSGTGPCVGDIPVRSCGPGLPACPVADAVCNLLPPSEQFHCGLAPEGVCWVPPSSGCPADSGAPRDWAACTHGPHPGPGDCVDFCTALLEPTPYGLRREVCH